MIIFLGSKITADGDYSHEIKRSLLLGRKVMTNLDSILKSRDLCHKGLFVASLVAQLVKTLPAMRETRVGSLGGRIPWRRKQLPTPVYWPGEFHGLQSMGSQTVGHD